MPSLWRILFYNLVLGWILGAVDVGLEAIWEDCDIDGGGGGGVASHIPWSPI